MSFPLPSVDLTSATVGTKGIISLQNAGISAGGISANPSLIDKPATLFMFNDSGCGLSIIFSQTGGGVNLPAGGWVPVPLPPGENKITWTVLYVLPSPPVSLLLLTYYPSGEDIPQSMTLGNSPVGIGGNVTTSSVQTLSNEGSASNLLVVDMGDTGHASIVTLYNDGHTLWSVDQSGTLHQVIKAQTAGTPLQLGQASDVTEVLGKLTVDQTSILTGILTAAAANVLGTAGNQQHILGTLLVDQLITTNTTLEIDSAGTTVNGSTSGSIIYFFPIWGAALKVMVISLASLNHNAGITISFPSTLARGLCIVSNLGGGTGTLQPRLAGANVGLDVITGLGGAAAGAISFQTNLHQASIGSIVSTIDGIVLTTVAATTVSGGILLIGA